MGAARRGIGLDRALIAVEVIVGVAVVAVVVGKGYGAVATIAFVVCGAALAASAWFLVRMLTSLSDETLDVRGHMADSEREQLEHEKLLLLQGLKEFEADAATGKVDQADYAHLKRTAEARAVEIISALKASDAYWMERAGKMVEKRLGKPVAAPAAPKAAPVPAPTTAASAAATQLASSAWPAAAAACFDDTPVDFTAVEGELECSGCGGKNRLEARYCMHCGRPGREVTA